MTKKPTSAAVTRELMRIGSPPQRAFMHYLAAPGERRLDALVKTTLDAMGYAGGPGYIRTITADDYAAGRPVVEKVATKLKQRTILPGAARE